MSENASRASNASASSSAIDIAQLNRDLRDGNTKLHQLLVAKKESLNRQAKKQRAFARSNWYSMMLYARKRVVMREASAYQNEKNKQLDVYANVAVRKLTSAVRFNNAHSVLEELTKNFFQPLKTYKNPPNVPAIEDAENEACIRYIQNLDFSDTLSNVASKFTEPINNVMTYEKLIPESDELMDIADDVVEDAAANIEIDPKAPNLFAAATSLAVFPQDNMILNPMNDINIILGVAAQQAVLYTPFTAGLPMVSKEIRPTFRGLLRYAYPRWDNEDPLDLEREPTLDEDDLNLDINRAIEQAIQNSQPAPSLSRSQSTENAGGSIFDRIFQGKDITPQPKTREISPQRDEDAEKMKDLKMKPGMKVRNFYYDLSSILPGLDDGVQRMIEPIPRIVLSHLLLTKQSILNLMFESTNGVAAKVANDPDQIIPEESLSFIDDAIADSMKDFVSGATGLTEAYDDLINFNIRASEQAMLATLTAMTFSRLQQVTPFLVGAANIKTHKLEEENNPDRVMRKKKHDENPVFNTTG